MESYLLFGLGLFLIIKGGDWFIDSSCFIAKITGVPQIIIGATIVSLATTLPEAFVSAIAVYTGANQLGISNALGSVICNTGLILSISLLYSSKLTDRRMVLTRGALMVISLLAVFLLSLDGYISIQDGIVLLLLLIVYIYMNVRNIRQQLNTPKAPCTVKSSSTKIYILKFIFGAAGIVIGARLLVNNGVSIANALGISQGVIGATIVAVGTSLPELVTTIASISKKQPSLAIGNIIGANILNLTMILSTCSFIGGGLSITPEYLPAFRLIAPRILYLDIPVATALFFTLLAPIFFRRPTRIQGIVMLIIYATFVLFLVLS